MTKTKYFCERVLKATIAFGIVLALPQVTWAAEDRAIEEIIVTGTKRDASAQDIPIALTAITDEQLRGTYRTDIMALTDMAPSVVIGQMAGFRAITGGHQRHGAELHPGDPGCIRCVACGRTGLVKCAGTVCNDV